MNKKSREFKCFSKILTTCQNRGFHSIGEEFVNYFGPKYLKKNEIFELKGELPKSTKYKNKVTFLDKIQFSGSCVGCKNMVEIGDAAFLTGKELYHVLCGLDNFGDLAKENTYYCKWLVVKNEKKI